MVPDEVPQSGAPQGAEAFGLALGLLNRRQTVFDAELHEAFPQGQLRLHYQVQQDLRTGAVVSLEALIRWAHPEQGLLAPAAFLPIAEDRGLMGSIDVWALDQACADAAWLATRGQAVEIAVNVTAAQLTDPNFVHTVEDACRHAGVPAGLVTVEMGLRDVLRHVDAARDGALELRRRGLRVSVSDVSTGTGSPDRLAALQVAELKVDRELVRHLTEPSSGAFEALRSIVAMARGQGARVVAEGVEEPAQLEAARAAGCDRVQGFLLGRPAPLADVVYELGAPAGR